MLLAVVLLCSLMMFRLLLLYKLDSPMCNFLRVELFWSHLRFGLIVFRLRSFSFFFLSPSGSIQIWHSSQHRSLVWSFAVILVSQQTKHGFQCWNNIPAHIRFDVRAWFALLYAIHVCWLCCICHFWTACSFAHLPHKFPFCSKLWFGFCVYLVLMLIYCKANKWWIM